MYVVLNAFFVSLQQMCSLMAQSLERVSTSTLQDQGVPDFIYSQGDNIQLAQLIYYILMDTGPF